MKQLVRMRSPTSIPLTAVGRVTVAILQFNQSERLEERDRLIWAGIIS
ncbi:MAG: hypothetical protein RMY64_19185 [Nostoc sp. DedQUE08]|nr:MULTISPECIES: hypothetical protein [unclassified Nostoc]MDZ8067715.1 hypothetical protein [Nostoc sp. DedQUE08]MDZ8132762.1 hypothetical protein [Nostoc sp. DedQUE07]